MNAKWKNRVWFIVGIALGAIGVGWGISQQWLYPVSVGATNWAAWAYVFAGLFLALIAWREIK